MNEDDKIKFLKELSGLSLKYRVQIGGCGCCGSPYLFEMDKGIEDGKYTCDRHDSDLSFRKEGVNE